MNVKIGIIHDKVKLGAKRTNLKRLYERTVMTVRERNVDVIVLPSYPLTGPLVGYYPPNKLVYAVRSYAERMSERGTAISQGTATILRWSEELGVYIIAGPLIERAGPRLYSTVVAASPHGVILGKYRKIGVTSEDLNVGISPGKKVSVIPIDNKIKIGLFVEEDLAYPEVFRLIQIEGANIIIGFMMPYKSEFFKITRYYNSDMLTMEEDSVGEFLSVRSRETGLPIILVGGAVNGTGTNHLSIAYMPTIPVEPDIGVVKDKMLRYEDLGGAPMILEINANSSRPRDLNSYVERTLKDICKRSLNIRME